MGLPALGAIAMQDVEIKVVLLRQMPRAGDERLLSCGRD
jgi:hypothetical protein